MQFNDLERNKEVDKDEPSPPRTTAPKFIGTGTREWGWHKESGKEGWRKANPWERRAIDLWNTTEIQPKVKIPAFFSNSSKKFPEKPGNGNLTSHSRIFPLLYSSTNSLPLISHALEHFLRWENKIDTFLPSLQEQFL